MPPVKKPAAKTARAPRKKPARQFIRNLRYVPVSVRLSPDRRIELKPRGARGDCVPLQKGDREFAAFDANVDLLFEIIGEEVANENIAKQNTNQRANHPAFDHIRTAEGERYSNPPSIQEELKVEGYNVGSIDERGMITRVKSLGTVDNPFRGEGTLTSNEIAAQTDEIARQKDIEGPQAGLGNLKITKAEPTTES